MILSRVVKGLRFYSTCKLPYYPATVSYAGRRHETPGPEAKDFITHGRASSISFMFSLVLLAPKSKEAKAEAGLDGSCPHNGFRKPQFYTSTARTPAQILIKRETLSSQKKVSQSQLKEGTTCLLRLLARHRSLKRVQDKSCHKTCRNKMENWRFPVNMVE